MTLIDKSPAIPGHRSRGVTLSALALAAGLIAQTPARAQDENWVGTWTANPQPVWGGGFALPTKIPATVRDQTIRQSVRISLGGSRLRFVFSNAYGSGPLVIGAASVAMPGQSNSRDATHKLTFGGKDGISIPAGSPAVSDPVDLNAEAQAQMDVSVYLPDETPLTTFHWDGRQTARFGKGDLTRATDFPSIGTTDARIFLSEVLVDSPNQGAVAVIGDSITDGNGSTLDADARWPDLLGRRLASRHVAVLNAGISGARLLSDGMGVSAVARIGRDVLAEPNVKAVIVLIGINDIAWPGTAFARQQAQPNFDALIAGYQQLVALAHAHNVRVVGATLTPFEGALSGTPLGDYYDPEKDALRQQVNHWIRESGAFDAVVDFDATLRDPSHPSRLAPALDSGDHLHPGDRGSRTMADAVDIDAMLGR